MSKLSGINESALRELSRVQSQRAIEPSGARHTPGSQSAVGKCCRVSANMLELADRTENVPADSLAIIRSTNAGQAKLLREAAQIADDMLAALKAVVDAHDEWTAALEPAKQRGAVFDDPISDAVEQARTTLSKATGEAR